MANEMIEKSAIRQEEDAKTIELLSQKYHLAAKNYSEV